MLTLRCFPLGPLQANCYLLSDGRAAVLVDPGDEPERLLAVLRAEGLTLEAIWLTHAHFDHVGAVEGITQAIDVPVYLHPADQPLYAQARLAAARWGIPLVQPTKPPTPLAAGGTLSFGGAAVECRYTPGHAPGHIAFYIPALNSVIAGDALFAGSIGRTDLPGGNYGQLIASIERELLTLPDDTVVYPGHGPATTIGQERRNNPFLQ